MADMRDRLIELIDTETEGHVENMLQPGGTECLADHLLANGVILPPCKVGDTVYDCLRNAYQVAMISAVNKAKHLSIVLKSGLNDSWIVDETDFGKIVYLTREAAEEALREKDE